MPSVGFPDYLIGKDATLFIENETTTAFKRQSKVAEENGWLYVQTNVKKHDTEFCCCAYVNAFPVYHRHGVTTERSAYWDTTSLGAVKKGDVVLVTNDAYYTNMKLRLVPFREA